MLEEHQRLFGDVKIEKLATDKGYFSMANEEAAMSLLCENGYIHRKRLAIHI